MTMTTHERPGVYSAYDASAVVSGSGGGKVVGLAALCTGAAAGEAVRITLRQRRGDLRADPVAAPQRGGGGGRGPRGG